MNKVIVVINGGPATGKDTFVDICRKYVKVVNVSSVDKIKEMAKIYLGWNGEKSEKSRKMLSDLKRVSIEYNDSPSNYMQQEAEKFLKSDNDMMFLHIRETEEIQKMKDRIDCVTLLIINNNAECINSNQSDKSDAQYNYCYDYTIDNSQTLEDLEIKAKNFIKELIQ